MRTRTTLLALVVATGLVAGACGGSDEGEDGDGRGADGAGAVRVVAALAPLAELAERVGGEGVEVEDLTPAGGEPHDLELTTDQVDDLLDADVVLLVGGGFQAAVEEAADGSDAEVIEVAPHEWLVPTVLAELAVEVAGALAEADPEGAGGYEERADAYGDELGALDRAIADGLTGCDRRVIVTRHAAFDPFAEHYDLTALSIAGSTPDAEPDPGHVADLTDRIRAEGITTVFSEPGAEDADLADTVAREAGVRTAVLDPIERLPDGSSYVEVQRANLEVLGQALGC
jgi:zinc transport system substrate-binding protein